MGRFAAAYRRHLGGTGSSVPFYGGFAAFFAGIAVAGLGIIIVISGETIIENATARNGLGITLAAIGLPLIFMGLQLTLPSRLGIHLLASAGAMVCLAGVVMFTQAWPGEWGHRGNPDRSGSIIFLYTIGVAALATTTALALVVNFVSRHVVLPGHELDDVYADPDRPVSMEEVMRDIEREVARQKLTWGGMEEDRLPRVFLKLSSDFGVGAHVSDGRAGKVTETMANEMDVAFTALARLRGNEGREFSGDDDTSTAIEALKALRRARQAELELSWWYRFKRWLVTLFTGKGPARASPAAPRADPGSQARPENHPAEHPKDQSSAARGADPAPTEAPSAERAHEMRTK